jgi:hypothetical protein
MEFNVNPPLDGPVAVGTRVSLRWNLRLPANVEVYQSYETESRRFSRLVVNVCADQRNAFDWTVPPSLVCKSDLFLYLRPKDGNRGVYSGLFSVVPPAPTSAENAPGATRRASTVRMLEQFFEGRQGRESVVGRRASDWVSSWPAGQAPNLYHRKPKVSSLQTVLPVVRNGVAVPGVQYHSLANIAYFEIVVEDCELFAKVSVGLAEEEFPLHDTMTGHTPTSYGYNHTGKIITNDGVRHGKEASEYESGDTIGCGLHVDTGNVFFTLNGSLVTIATPGHLRQKQSTVYPTVSCAGHVQLRVVFGNQSGPYRFNAFKAVGDLCAKRHTRRKSWGSSSFSSLVVQGPGSWPSKAEFASSVQEIEGNGSGDEASGARMRAKHRRHSLPAQGWSAGIAGQGASKTPEERPRRPGGSSDDDEEAMTVYKAVSFQPPARKTVAMKKLKGKLAKQSKTSPSPPPPSMLPTLPPTPRGAPPLFSQGEPPLPSTPNPKLRKRPATPLNLPKPHCWPTEKSGSRWVLKKKGRRTGATVTRHFYIAPPYHFVYFEDDDDLAGVRGRIKVENAVVTVAGEGTLRVQCPQRTDPIYVECEKGVAARDAMRDLYTLSGRRVDIEAEAKVRAEAMVEKEVATFISEDQFKRLSTPLPRAEDVASMKASSPEKVPPVMPALPEEVRLTLPQKIQRRRSEEEEEEAAEDHPKEETGEKGDGTTALRTDTVVAALPAGPSLVPPGACAYQAWTNEEVCQWVSNGLSLPQYETSFRNIGIDGDMLEDIIEDDLVSDLKVTVRLHRKKILKAISKLRAASMDGGDDGMLETPVSTDVLSRDSSLSEASVTVPVRDSPTIAALFSNPLVFSLPNDPNKYPVDALDWETERKLLCRSLREAGGAVTLRFSHATTDSLRTALTKGCRVLHYSGHAEETYLSFEDGAGGLHCLENERLRELFAAGSGGADTAAGCGLGQKPRLVFVSACRSSKAGEAFLDAGAQHVVCVETASAIEDRAAQAFTRAFYCALARGYAVDDAFDIGRVAVMSSPAVGHGRADTAKEESAKFVLLPKDANHAVSIFPDVAVENGWQEPAPLSWEVLPALPESYIPRHVVVYEIVANLLARSRRIVSVCGARGHGKSTIVKASAHYLADRRAFVDGILYINCKSAASLTEEILSALEERAFRGRKGMPSRRASGKFVEVGSDARAAEEAANKYLLSHLHDKQCLIVLDDLSAADGPFLAELLAHCHQVQMLGCMDTPLEDGDSGGRLGDFFEHIVRVGPMSSIDICRLIMQRTPTIQFQDLVAFQDEIGKLTAPSEACKLARKLSRGEPLSKEIFAGL